ncbi:MAG: PEP-CTERM sorting domain-containing protein [Planctomycetota bacterium]|nr:MAG: PEP-CTERM sorting domain-containing protein [Planctomycetota bacterium]REJ96306.1 MAG: PEP-CTERM sorting domain-containing protein [Planctomycetota bacterium]REK30609.1 MAG: PEP-CTERM sorting domain-containing protein [Planctomycetota bacterium]REK44242.1 MAG: PEP-CTERM sorting domain-containing protein [Planctomycetota bacterium]
MTSIAIVDFCRTRVCHGFAIALLLALTLVLSSGVAQAAPLNMIPLPPDVTSSFLSVSYDATTRVFTATGFATTVDLDGLAPPDYAIDGGFGGYSLTAVIDNDRKATGTITITGTVAAAGFNSGTLLTGDVNIWGFLDGGGEIFEFGFGVTGGDLAPLFPQGTYVRGGTIISAVNSGFDGVGVGPSTPPSNSFANDGFSGFSDTFAVPEPSTYAMMGLGAAALIGLGIRRRRQRRQA